MICLYWICKTFD